MLDIAEPIVRLLGVGLQFSGDSSMSAESDLVSSVTIVYVAGSLLSAESDLVSDGTALSSPVSMSAESDLSASITVTLVGASSLSSESDLVSDVNIALALASSLSASFNLSVSTNIVALAASLSNGGSDLLSSIRIVYVADSTLTAESNLGANAELRFTLVPRALEGDLNLSAALYEPLNVLVLPTVEDTYTEDRLLRRYSITSGKSLIINGTAGTIQDFFSQDQTLDADYYFAGGHRYVLNPTEVAAVETAGFGDLITIETL